MIDKNDTGILLNAIDGKLHVGFSDVAKKAGMIA